MSKRARTSAPDADDAPPQQQPRRAAAAPSAPRTRPAASAAARPPPSLGALASALGSGGSAAPAGASVPLGALAAALRDGRDTQTRRPRALSSASQGPPRRANKNRPLVQSSRRPVARLHAAPGLDAAAASVGRRLSAVDPRFDRSLPSATPAAEIEPAFRKRYKFLFDEQLPAERARLKAAASREARRGGARPAARAAELRAAAGAAGAALRREAAARAAERAAAEARGAERAAVGAGKRPFYPKKADARRAALLARFEALKKSGQLASFLAKRRAKLATRDHVLVPRERRARQGGAGGGGGGGAE